MSGRVGYSRRAAAKVEEIAGFLEEHGPVAGRRFHDALVRVERQLSEFPNSGVPGTRRLVVGKYIFPIGGLARMSKSSRSVTPAARNARL